MADRITRAHVEGALKSFCKLADLPYSDGSIDEPNALWVSGANGGWRVERIAANGKGSSAIWNSAFRPAKMVYNEIHVAMDTLWILPAEFLRKRLEEVETKKARRQMPNYGRPLATQAAERVVSDFDRALAILESDADSACAIMEES